VYDFIYHENINSEKWPIKNLAIKTPLKCKAAKPTQVKKKYRFFVEAGTRDLFCSVQWQNAHNEKYFPLSHLVILGEPLIPAQL
jgi:hypothetical protein